MKKLKPMLNLLIVFFISTALSEMGVAQIPDSSTYWPTYGWHKSTPEQQGMDSETLSQAFDLIKEHNINIHSLQIIRNGYLVLNAYFYPFPKSSVHDLASVTKSITSILIGIAIDKGFISSVDIPVIELFPDYKISNIDTNIRKLTIKSLLTMTSGYNCSYEDGEKQLFDMRKSSDWVQYMLDMPIINEPGTHFSYCSGNFHLLAGIILKTTGLSPKEFAQKYLFTPLGINQVIWPSDPNGINFGWGDLHLYPIDMAKIGYLFLNNGKWEDKQIVSPLWINQSTQKSVRLSDSDYYGYGWWIRTSPEPGIYEALGRDGQRIVVWPDNNIVVVFSGGGFEPAEVGEYIVKAVKSDKSLPENEQAYKLLQEKLKNAAAPPSPNPLKKLPEITRGINGKEYICEDNTIDLKRISLFFPNEKEGLIKIIRENSTLDIPFGLDDIYRISPTGDLGLPRVSKGVWETENKLLLDLYQVSRMDLDEMILTFESDKVVIEIDGITVKGEYKKTR